MNTTCEAKCCRMAKASVASAISTLETMKKNGRVSETNKVIVKVCDMLRTYECVSAACLMKRAESVAKKIRGGESFLDREQKGILAMLIAEMKTFCNS